MRRFFLLIVFGLSFILTSCDSISIDELETYQSEQDYCTDDLSPLEHMGALNAVKKAYQLTDIEFTPLNSIGYNLGSYQPNASYTGMIYSSVKEIGTYVGSNVSFHTFMTAIHNPRSRIYTEKINHEPYHGTNCKAYYGTVCSDLVSYSLGLLPGYGSYDFPASSMMKEIDHSNPDNIHIADVMWRTGHVAIITDVKRNKRGKVCYIELSEAAQHGCRKRLLTRNGFERNMESPYEKVFRYINLADNTDYTPATEFVSVLDEKASSYKYNEMICSDKGDKANYLEGDKIVLNVFSPYKSLVVYKDGAIFSSYNGNDSFSDLTLTNLPYGNYYAEIVNNNGETERTSWIVVNYYTSFNSKENSIFFHSKNADPFQAEICSKAGGRAYHPMTEIFNKVLSYDDVSSGRVDIPKELMKDDCPYYQVMFKTEYGIITTGPIKIK